LASRQTTKQIGKKHEEKETKIKKDWKISTGVKEIFSGRRMTNMKKKYLKGRTPKTSTNIQRYNKCQNTRHRSNVDLTTLSL
jgi:hypothetical protein